MTTTIKKTQNATQCEIPAIIESVLHDYHFALVTCELYLHEGKNIINFNKTTTPDRLYSLFRVNRTERY